MRVLLSLCVFLSSVVVVLPATVAAAQGQPAVTVEPSSGPYGTTFQPRVTGLPPGGGVVVVMRFPAGNEERGPSLAVAPPSGEWRPKPWLSAEPEPLGQYTILIKTSDSATVLASGSFTVLGTDQAGTPTGQPAGLASGPGELPKTGDLPTSTSPFVLIGFALLLAGGALRRLRR
jgi:hypothetical protein